MELETAARRHLLGLSAVNGYVVGKVFKNTLLVSPERSGGYAIVVRRGSGWSKPDLVKSSEFPRLIVECWADPDRDLQEMRAVDNAADKAWALFRVVDAALHRVRDQWWGAGGDSPGLRIISCVRSEEPVVLTGGGGSVDGRQVVFGEMAMVPAVYEVHTVH